MKKIICTVTNDLTYDQRMIRICTSLSKAGYRVTLVGRLRSFSKPLQQEPFQQVRLRCWLNQGKLFYLEYNVRLFFFLFFHSFDAVCSVDLDTLLPGFWVSRFKGKACVFDAHEYFTEVPEVVRRPRVKKIWEILADWLLPKLKYAYTVGGGLADIFEKRYGIPFSVIRNVPFTQQALAERPRNPIILLYQGALNEGRGLEYMIETMKDLENTELWLAGEGDLSTTLRKLTQELDLEKKVSFLGFLSPDELKKVTLKATIGLNLLENKGLSYYYSLANKAFDYIQAGIPSINMNFPEYQKINKEFDVFLLIDDLHPATLRKAIEDLRDDELYNRLHKNCLVARKKLVWEEEEKQLLEFWKDT